MRIRVAVEIDPHSFAKLVRTAGAAVIKALGGCLRLDRCRVTCQQQYLSGLQSETCMMDASRHVLHEIVKS